MKDASGITWLFPFGKRFPGGKTKRLPVVEDLGDMQRKKLPAGGVSHLEWRMREAFGREVRVLLCWLVGRKLPVRWVEDERRWVDDSGK